MYFLYTLALSISFVVLLPYFLYQAIARGKYVSSLKQRLGFLPSSLGHDGRPSIWVHAVSVGEFLAACPLIESIRRQMPDYRIVISTTTATGQQLAQARMGAANVFYFPLDWAFAVRRSLDLIRPKAVVTIETEIWPNFLHQCRKRGVLTVLANGRISARSFNRYRLARHFFSKVLADLSLLIMQSEADARRALLLGAHPDRVRVCGNLKYDVRTEDKSEAAEKLDRLFALSSSPRLIVAGSTAPGEEAILLIALSEVSSQPGLKGTRLVIAPRHPERFDEVADLVSRSGFSLARRSGRPTEHARTAEVILLDSIGELAAAYRFADAVFVGGSLVPRGGHNVIEPALHSKPIIVGPHTENFRQVIADFSDAEAIVQLADSGQLAPALIRLLSDRQYAQAMGERARAILTKNRGATQCTIAALRSLL
jgi:3-deoxy-D-manno-octulosonic-acid transferase